MAEFHEIGSSQFTDVTPTGEEKIQISASQRTTLQNIANLAPEKGVKQVVVTNFQTNTWKLRDGGNVSFPTDIKVGEIVTFTSAQDAVKGPGVALFGYAIKHNNLMASYVGMTTSNKVNGIPTIYTYKSAVAYATAWQQLPDASVKTVEITDFAIPGYTKVNGGYIDCSLVNGSTTVVSLTRSVPANTTCFIEADVQTSVTGGTVKTSSALMFFRLASGSTMCDINSRALGGTNIGQVKLNVATVNNQTSFVIVTTSYGLDSSVSGGIIRIKNIYAKL